jgi:hypothetical protein
MIAPELVGPPWDEVPGLPYRPPEVRQVIRKQRKTTYDAVKTVLREKGLSGGAAQP